MIAQCELYVLPLFITYNMYSQCSVRKFCTPIDQSVIKPLTRMLFKPFVIFVGLGFAHSQVILKY